MEVRQCLADGELELAGQCPDQAGMEALGPEPVLEALRKELQGETEYRAQLRKAQMLFDAGS